MSTSPFEIHKVYTGKEFNEIAIRYGMKFYKFTNHNEIHHGFQIRDGLNVDTIEFNPRGECQAGGLYFTDKEHALCWKRGNTFFREVTIPDDAQVYIEKLKYKTDKFILGPRMKISQYIYADIADSIQDWESKGNLRKMNYLFKHVPDIIIKVIKEKPQLIDKFDNGRLAMKEMIKRQPEEFADINITFRITASK